MSYGVCARCKRFFPTSYEFDEHNCMTNAMKMTRLELARDLYSRGKMSETMWLKVQEEEK